MANGFQGPPAVDFYSMLSGLGDSIKAARQDQAKKAAFAAATAPGADYRASLLGLAAAGDTQSAALLAAMHNHDDTLKQQAIENARQSGNDTFSHGIQSATLGLAKAREGREAADYENTPDQYVPNPNAGKPGEPAYIDQYAAATAASAPVKPFEVDVPGPFGTTTKQTVVRGPDGSLRPLSLNSGAPSGGGIFGGMSKPVGWDASAPPQATAPQSAIAPTAVASTAPASFGDRFSAAAPQSVAPAAPPAAPQVNAPANLDAIDPATGRREAWLKTQSPAEAAVIQKVAEGKLDIKTLPEKMRYGVIQGVSTYMPGYDQAAGDVPQATVDFLADRTRLGDTHTLMGLSRTPGLIARVQNAAAQREAAGIPISNEAKSVVNNTTTLGARRSAENKLGTITTNNEFYGNNALGAMDIAEKASADVPRSNYPDVNAAINAYKTKTGDPKTVALGAALNTVINDYAKFSGGGVGTDALRGEAMSMLNSKHSHDQVKAVLDMMRTEIKRGQQSPGMVRGTFNDVYAPGGSGAPPKAQTAPQVPASSAPLNVTSTGIKWSVQ
jgi:hypothetical protein